MNDLNGKKIFIDNNFAGEVLLFKITSSDGFIVTRNILGSGVPIIESINYKVIKKSGVHYSLYNFEDIKHKEKIYFTIINSKLKIYYNDIEKKYKFENN
jgi:hypothetical protein